MIDAAGGELAYGPLSLIVPPGALPGATTITLSEIPDPPRGAVGPAYEFAPDGLPFAVAATLKVFYEGVTLPPGTEPASLRGGISLSVVVAFSVGLASTWPGCDSSGAPAHWEPGHVQAMMPCTADSGCRAHPMYDDVIAAGYFPPICINGMCQVVTTHRCETDEECVDVRNWPGWPRCITYPEMSDGKLCETTVTRPPFVGDEDNPGVHCYECCFPQDDPDTSRYSCAGFICYALATPRPDPSCVMGPADDGFRIGGCSVGLP